jgi:hypothetical protein
MCSSPDIPPPATPNPVIAPPETVGEGEGTVKKDFGINPATGKPEARRRGLRALRLPAMGTSTTPQA